LPLHGGGVGVGVGVGVGTGLGTVAAFEFAVQLPLGLPPLALRRNRTCPPAPKSQVQPPDLLPVNEPPGHVEGVGVPGGPSVWVSPNPPGALLFGRIAE
jgi:hypothetical protein